MRTLQDINLASASLTLAVANTPLFLLRKLRADPSVHEIAASFGGDEILAELSRLACSEPRDVIDYVRPYAFLVSLSMLPSIDYLKRVASIKGTDRWEWFSYIHRVLLDTYIPTEHVPLKQDQSPVGPSIRTDSAVNFEPLVPERHA